MNIMKAGLHFSHRIVAVSEGYAWECQTQEGGWGLDAIIRENNWKLRGIVNGIDYKEWSPKCDPALVGDGYTQYDVTTLEEGKKKCKVGCDLRASLGLFQQRCLHVSLLWLAHAATIEPSRQGCSIAVSSSRRSLC